MSLFASIADFERLPAKQQHCLIFLRGLRDVIARDLEFDLNTEKAEEWIHDAVTYNYPWSSFNKMENRIMEQDKESISRKYGLLKLFRLVVLRIARLEREGCRVPKDMWERELLTA